MLKRRDERRKLSVLNWGNLETCRTLKWWCRCSCKGPSSATGGHTIQAWARCRWRAARRCGPHSPRHWHTAPTRRDMGRERWRWSERAPAESKEKMTSQLLCCHVSVGHPSINTGGKRGRSSASGQIRWISVVLFKHSISPFCWIQLLSTRSYWFSFSLFYPCLFDIFSIPLLSLPLFGAPSLLSPFSFSLPHTLSSCCCTSRLLTSLRTSHTLETPWSLPFPQAGWERLVPENSEEQLLPKS